MDAKATSLLRRLRARFEDFYGSRLVKVVVYGSQARGDADEESDVDVMVALRGRVCLREEWDRTEDELAEICLGEDVVIACAFVSNDEYERDQSPLLINVRREGVTV